MQDVSAWIGANTSQCLRGTALSISFPWKDENFRFDLAGTIPATMKFSTLHSRARGNPVGCILACIECRAMSDDVPRQDDVGRIKE